MWRKEKKKEKEKERLSEERTVPKSSHHSQNSRIKRIPIIIYAHYIDIKYPSGFAWRDK